MNRRYITRRVLYGIPLILGVTFVSFLLMVYFGPDKTYELLGKNPTTEQISEVRRALGYDRAFLLRYGDYLRELVTLDLGLSDSSGEPVSVILKRTQRARLLAVKLTNGLTENLWFPCSTLREIGGNIFAARWIIEKKEKELIEGRISSHIDVERN